MSRACLARLIGVVALALLPALSAPAGETPGADPEAAKRFILTLGNEAIAVLNGAGRSPSERDAELRRLMVRHFDLDLIGRVALGRYWRVATEAERDEYRQLFEAYLLEAYVRRLSRFAGEILVVEGARSAPRGVAVVRSRLESPKRPAMRVDWLVQLSNGRYRVIDVAVEGVSMAITRRAEFAAIIEARGGRVAGLLDALREKLG